MKPFAAEFTDEGFISRVDSCVSVESGTSVESFATLVAFMRFFLQTDGEETISHTMKLTLTENKSNTDKRKRARNEFEIMLHYY